MRTDSMITTTLDPISLNDVTDIENAPYIVEGEGQNALKIYFESEANRLEYLNTPLHGSDDMAGLKNIYDDMADNPNTGSIN
jgi:hypothetical protein